MERLDPLAAMSLLHRNSDVRNCFLFSSSPNSGPELASLSEGPRPRIPDPANLHVLSLLADALQKGGFSISKPEINKTGQASSLVTFSSRRIGVFLAVKRREERMSFFLLTLQSGRSSPSTKPTEGNEWEELSAALNRILLTELRADSVQRLTQREAEVHWRRLSR
jgi:hypothetical protein